MQRIDVRQREKQTERVKLINRDRECKKKKIMRKKTKQTNIDREYLKVME